MSNLVCQNCKSIAVEYEDYVGGTSYYRCKTCGMRGNEDKFTQVTLFDRITVSMEVLAPKFVYHVTSFLDGLNKPKKIWYSTLINNQYFNTELEAKRATVAKLKEVYNG